MNKKDQPVYIIGSERSGTNLLRKLLSNHSKISGPQPPQIINTLYKSVRFYGGLQSEPNLRQLYEHFKGLANHKFTNWDLNINLREFNPKGDNIFFELLHYFYRSYALSEKKDRYVSKELNAHKYFEHIVNVHPNSIFIHIVRNPLEHVASWMRTPLFTSDSRIVIDNWVEVNNDILILKHLYPEKILTIKYEDLVKETKRTMTEVLLFINADIEEGCFSNTIESKSNNWNELWKNVNKPVENNLNKYKKTLYKVEINLIKQKSKDLCIELGYELKKSTIFKETIINKFQKRLISKVRSQNRKKVKGYELTMERVNYGRKIRNEVKRKYLSEQI